MPPIWTAPELADAATPLAPTSANAIAAANRTCVPTMARHTFRCHATSSHDPSKTVHDVSLRMCGAGAPVWVSVVTAAGIAAVAEPVSPRYRLR